MTERMVRRAVSVAALTEIREHADCSGVLVSDYFPGKNLEPETIWIGEIDGEISYPTMQGPDRKYRDDMFTVPVNIRVARGQTMTDGRDRLEELLSVVDDVFATITTFAGIDGLVSIEATEARTDAQDTPTGFVGFGQVVLEVHSRLV